MASLLQEAEQQGILDVYLAKLTHHEWLSVPQKRIGYIKNNRERDSELLRRETTVHHWRRLDDSKPGFKEEVLDDQEHDCILQVSLDAPSIQHEWAIWGAARGCGCGCGCDTCVLMVL